VQKDTCTRPPADIASKGAKEEEEEEEEEEEAAAAASGATVAVDFSTCPCECPM